MVLEYQRAELSDCDRFQVIDIFQSTLLKKKKELAFVFCLSLPPILQSVALALYLSPRVCVCVILSL